LKDHIVKLTGGNDSAVRKRLRKLWEHEYLLRRVDPRKSALHQPPIYHLGKEGEQLLIETTDLDPERVRMRRRLDREFSPSQLPHALMIAHIRCVFTLATRMRPDIKLLFWRHDKEVYDTVPIGGDPLFEDEYKETWPIVPDAYFGLQFADGTGYCMLEADRGSMDEPRFKKKLRAYWLWWRYGGHTKKLNINRFIVLTVAPQRDRALNLFKLSREVDDRQKGCGLFWFTTYDKFDLENPELVFADIWARWHDGQRARAALVQ
jgi:hypothetical protein